MTILIWLANTKCIKFIPLFQIQFVQIFEDETLATSEVEAIKYQDYIDMTDK